MLYSLDRLIMKNHVALLIYYQKLRVNGDRYRNVILLSFLKGQFVNELA